jgi:hypothetical protein
VLDVIQERWRQLKPSTVDDGLFLHRNLKQWFPTFFLQGPPNSFLMEFVPPPIPFSQEAIQGKSCISIFRAFI